MKKTAITLILAVASFVSASAITPTQAYREICDLPTVRQNMPATEINLGSGMVFFGAQTAGTVATQLSEIDAVITQAEKIASAIDDRYFVTAVGDNDNTIVYYADKQTDDLYDVLCIDVNSTRGYFQATLSQAPASTVETLSAIGN